jgi:hypothetical protein
MDEYLARGSFVQHVRAKFAKACNLSRVGSLSSLVVSPVLKKCGIPAL